MCGISEHIPSGTYMPVYVSSYSHRYEFSRLCTYSYVKAYIALHIDMPTESRGLAPFLFSAASHSALTSLFGFREM
jgi:hypothetical protein